MAFVNICLTVKRSVDVGVDETIISCADDNCSGHKNECDDGALG